MTGYLLDTSALLIDYFREPGWQTVNELLRDERVMLASPTVVEFLVSALAAGVPRDQAESDLAGYLEVADHLVPIDAAVAMAAWELRAAATARIPVVDCLIAGCASVRRATLVHRDAHYSALPAAALQQQRLSV